MAESDSEREDLIEIILNNDNHSYDEEELNDMTTKELENVIREIEEESEPDEGYDPDADDPE